MKVIPVQIYLAVITFLIPLSGCENDDGYIIKHFPREKQLSAIKMPFDFIIERMETTLVDNHLVYLSSYASDTLIHVFSLPDIKHVKSFGVRGNGPGEFNSTIIVYNNQNKLYMTGLQDLSLIKEFDVHGFCSEKLPLKEFHLKDIYIFDISNMHIINDSIMFYFEDASKLILRSYNMITQEQINHREIKIIGDEDQEIPIFRTNIGCLLANESTVAYAHLYKDKIDFMNHDFSLKKGVKGTRKDFMIDRNNFGNSILYYVGGFVGKERFYFTYINCRTELGRLKKDKSIEVYDKDGNPVIVYHVDNEMLSFVVDEKHNKIYAYGEDDDSILVYDLEQ